MAETSREEASSERESHSNKGIPCIFFPFTKPPIENDVTKFIVHQPELGIQYPPTALFAVVQIGGAQYKVVENDIIVCEKIAGAEISSIIEFPAVKMVGTASYTLLGRPNVEAACVQASVEQQTKSTKLIVFKKKRRKGYKRNQGHRQELTILRIKSIDHKISEEMMERAVSLGL